jgi:MFS family permease
MDKKVIILFALVCQFVANLLFFASLNELWLYPATMFQALSLASFSPIALALVTDLAPSDERGKTLGMYLTIFGLSMFIGPFLCSIFTSFLSYRYIFLLTSLFPLLGLGISLLGGIPSGSASPDEQRIEGIAREQFIPLLKEIVTSKTALSVFLGRVAFTTPLTLFNTLFPIYAEQRLLLSASVISLLFALRGLSNMLIRMPIGKFSDAIGRKRPYLVACVLPVSALLIFSYATNLPLIAIACTTYGIGWGMNAVLSSTLLGDSVSRQAIGIAIAVSHSMFGLGKTIGSLATSFLTPLLPTPSIFVVSTVFGLLSLIFAVLLIKESDSH